MTLFDRTKFALAVSQALKIYGAPNLPSCKSASNSETHVEICPALNVMKSSVDIFSTVTVPVIGG
jgi:hypothetical protein